MRTNVMSRHVDFWCLGGASILIWALMRIFSTTEIPSVLNHKANLPAVALSLSLLVNFPHFMASYDQAYSRGREFIRQNWFQLLLVPAALLVVGLISWFSMKTTGQMWMGQLVNFMFFTVGWHYSKQVYGCVMVYAKYDNYPLTDFQRKIIRYNLMAIWWLTFVQANLVTKQQFIDLEYQTLQLWPGLEIICKVVFSVTLIMGIYFLYKNYRDKKLKPSINFLVPILAFYVWWIPGLRDPILYISLVALFHSLQYMVFVARIKIDESTANARIDEGKLTKSIVFLILTGWCAFELFPNVLDRVLVTKSTVGFTFFLIYASLFINIHHYFIDNVIWRLRDEHVRKSLFGSAS